MAESVFQTADSGMAKMLYLLPSAKTMNLKPGRVGCGDEGTASFAIDAVRKLTTSYGSELVFRAAERAERVTEGVHV